jgi:hypothetical protein
VLSKARDLAPRGLTGATLESLDFKTKVYKRKGIVFTIVGPTVGHRVKIAERRLRTRHWMSTKTMREVWHDPVLTSHLVEKGHGGPHPAKAHPFLRPAAESQFPLMEGRYGAALRAEIDRLARKGVA